MYHLALYISYPKKLKRQIEVFGIRSLYMLFMCRNDIETSFNLEIRIISPTMRGPWYGTSKVVDSDTTNFKDLVDEIMDQFPCGYGDVVKLFYFCADS
jgi:hypothetical protein